MAQPADQNAGGCLSPSLWSKREGAGARVPILTQAPLIAPHVDRSHIRSVPKNALVLSCAIDDEKPTCRYLYRVTASQVCGRMSTQTLSKRSGARFDVLGLRTQVTVEQLRLPELGRNRVRVWMPINDLLSFLDTFRLTDSWPVLVEIECFNGHASYRSTFSDRYRSGTFAGPA
jgi:hypothetical protein